MIDRPDFPTRRGPSGAFGALISCACGHGIGAHTQLGCCAGTSVRCACRIPDATVLERAIAQVARELHGGGPAGRRSK